MGQAKAKHNLKESICITGLHMSYWPAQTILLTFLITYLSGNGYSPSQVGMVATVQTVTNLFAQPLWGYVADNKFTIRRVVICCGVMTMALPMLNLVFIRDYYLIVVINFLYSMFGPPLAGLIDSWTYKAAETNHKIIYGLSRGIGSLMSAVACLFAGLFLDYVGIEKMFLLNAVLMIGLVVFAVLSPEKEQNKRESKKQLTLFQAISTLFKNKKYVMFILVNILLNIGLKSALTYTPIIIGNLGGSNVHIGYSMAVNTSMMLPFMLLYTWLSKRISNQVLYLWACVFTILRVFSLTWVSTLGGVIAVQIINSASYGFLQPAMLAFVKDNSPSDLQATAITLITAVFTAVSGIVGNYVAGIMIENIGMTAMFNAMGIVAILGTVLFLLVVRR